MQKHRQRDNKEVEGENTTERQNPRGEAARGKNKRTRTPSGSRSQLRENNGILEKSRGRLRPWRLQQNSQSWEHFKVTEKAAAGSRALRVRGSVTVTSSTQPESRQKPPHVVLHFQVHIWRGQTQLRDQQHLHSFCSSGAVYVWRHRLHHITHKHVFTRMRCSLEPLSTEQSGAFSFVMLGAVKAQAGVLGAAF